MHRKMLPTDDRPLRPRPFEQCDELLEFIAREFQHTDCRFGELHVPVPMEDPPSSLLLGELPREARAGWTWVDEVDVLVDPRRGALLMRSVERQDGESLVELSDDIAAEYADLRGLEATIRARLAALDFWKERPVPVASVVVVGRERPAEIVVPRSVPAAAVITRDGLEGFRDRLPALFDAVLPADARGTGRYGTDACARLVHDLIVEPCLGEFIGEECLMPIYRDWDREEASA